jgi:hypothetical protein
MGKVVLNCVLMPALQEIVRPNTFWYSAATTIDLPFNIVGLVLFQLVTMHWVETKVTNVVPPPVGNIPHTEAAHTSWQCCCG